MNQRIAFALTGFGAIGLYLLGLFDIPLFYDEAALRRYNGRAFIDGFAQMNFFPQCASISESAWLLRPAHVFFSWVDSWPSWAGVRLIPMLSTLLLVGSAWLLIPATVQGHRARLLILGGFVGVSGAGLLLFRPEFVLSLHVAVCAWTWWLARKPMVRPLVLAATLLLHLGITLLSLFVHLQGVLLLPLGFIACMRLLRCRPVLAGLVAATMVLMGAQSLQQFTYQCPGDRDMEAVMRESHGVVYSSSLVDKSWLERSAQRAAHQVMVTLFWEKPRYSVPVPEMPRAAAWIANPFIALTVIMNMVALVGGIGWMLRQLWRDYRALLSWRTLRKALHAISGDGRAVWTLAALILLFYSCYDQGGMFYRAHWRNLMTAWLLAVGVAYCPPSRWIRRWLLLVVVASLMSMVMVWAFMRPQLLAGYESYYVTLQRDWRAWDKRVQALAKRCGIPSEATHLVSDIATYRALREHPYPIDYNYVWYYDYLKTSEMPKRTEKEWLDYYKQFSSSGYVVQCRSLESAPLPVQHRDGQLCCGSFAQEILR